MSQLRDPVQPHETGATLDRVHGSECLIHQLRVSVTTGRFDLQQILTQPTQLVERVIDECADSVGVEFGHDGT